MSLVKILKEQESAWDYKTHPIKVEDLNRPVEFWNKVADIFKEFLVDEMGHLPEWVGEFECRRRDGFIPYSSNKGGMRGYHYGDQLQYYFDNTGFENFDKECEKTYDYIIDCFLDDAKITREEYEKGIDNNDENMLNLREEAEQSFREYESTYFETMLKIEDDNTLYVCFTLSASDAPYHRGYDDIIEYEIKFNSVDELKEKLYNLLENDDVDSFRRLVDGW